MELNNLEAIVAVMAVIATHIIATGHRRSEGPQLLLDEVAGVVLGLPQLLTGKKLVLLGLLQGRKFCQLIDGVDVPQVLEALRVDLRDLADATLSRSANSLLPKNIGALILRVGLRGASSAPCVSMLCEPFEAGALQVVGTLRWPGVVALWNGTS